jgi:hypothetical protein
MSSKGGIYSNILKALKMLMKKAFTAKYIGHWKWLYEGHTQKI